MRVDARGVRVLVADEDAAVRDEIGRDLERQGYVVTFARDGAEALEVARRQPFQDVLVLDAALPVVSAYRVLTALDSDVATSPIPVILLTSSERADDVARGFEHGASDHLVKPVSLVELEARLGHQVRILQTKRALVAHADALERIVHIRTRELHEALLRITDMHDVLKAKTHETTLDLLEARRFQDLAWPKASQLAGFAVAAANRPAGVVGGDLADVRPYGESGIRIFLADATGHGVQAALRSMVVKTMYDSVCKKDVSPAAVMTLLNHALAETYPDLEAKVDAACIDVRVTREGSLEITGSQAGGVAVGVFHDGVLDELRAPGLPLGIGSLGAYADTTRAAGRDAVVVVMSDGVLEQSTAAGARFEWEGVEASLRTSRGLPSIDERLEWLFAAWTRSFAGGAQEDDASCVCVAWKMSENRR